jgi:hypothetical protein
MRVDPTPEQLLGLPVLEPGGRPLGVVVDVGLSNWRQPKFLLVQPAARASLVRVEFGAIKEVRLGEVLLEGALPLPA